MISLPISGLQAQWRPPTGHADIVLAESPPGLAGAVAVRQQRRGSRRRRTTGRRGTAHR